MAKFFKWLALSVAVLVCAVLAGRVIFPLPDRSHLTPDAAIPVAEDTRWGRFLTRAALGHAGQTGVLPLQSGHEALASRLLLVSQAERSIDLQYYIWNADESGKRLMRDLVAAANRGVRVRILLDDNGVKIDDDTLAALDALDNLEIRLFNPSTIRTPKLAGYAIDFFRMNRRMHNKAFIVDGAAAIVGGRNIGDEYFTIGDITHFHDLDVLAAGHIVPETAANFDLFWNSEAVYPVADIVGRSQTPLPAWAATADVTADAELNQSLAAGLEAGKHQLEWTSVVLVSDHPSKGLGTAKPDQLMTHGLMSVIGPINRSLHLISAYFVPGRDGVAVLGAVRKGGATVSVLTNSFRATDVPMVHSGYAKYRKALLEDGVSLLEMKPDASMTRGADELSLTGSSGSSLHAKSLSIDDDRIFIGSFNFDPRSAYLNCEMGFLIGSPSMARQMRESFENQILWNSYAVSLDGEVLQWTEMAESGPTKTYDVEPQSNWFQRRMLTVMGWLPIEWLL